MTTYLFAGKKLTLEEFAVMYCEADMVKAEGLLEILVETGKAQIMPEKQDPAQMIIEEALKKYAVIERAEDLTEEERQHQAYLLNKKRENKATYDKVGFEFPTKTAAEEFQIKIEQMMLSNSLEHDQENSLYVVNVLNVTDKDLNSIKLAYKSQRAVESTLNKVNNVAGKTAGVVSYAGERVVVPTAQVAGKASMSIFKSLAKTVVKTGSTLTSAVVHGTKDTITEIKRDPDVIKATADIKKSYYDVKASRNKGVIKGDGIRLG